MEERLKDYERTIVTKHSFGSPKYKEDFHTSLSKTVFIPVAEKAISKLDWDIVYKNENSIEAKRKETSFGIEKWTEAITITFNHGNVEVKSQSLGTEMWDLGKNSKRVKLFIHVFKETEKEFDKDALNELEIETEKNNNLDNYIIPENLPQAGKVKKSNFSILIAGGLIISLLLGFIIAEVSIHVIYVIGIFEVLVAMAVAYSLKYLIELSHFLEIQKIKYLLMVMIFVIYFSNQYFQYEIILSENDFGRIGFLNFMQIRFSQGLLIKNLNTGWIGLVLGWILQLVITYYVALSILISSLITYKIKRIPIEVLDFTYYYIVKGKSETEIRDELSKRGWTGIENQNEVFEAIDAMNASFEIRRLK